jgi:thiamine transporter ThiT
MHVTEPVTMLTDYTLAAASLGFAAVLRRGIGSRNRVTAWLWCAAFIASALAAAFGGTYHGFAAHLRAGTLGALWNLTVFAMGACGAFIVAGVHAASFKWSDGAVRWLACGIAVTLLGGAVQQGGFPRGARFNHNDAYHLIQIVGLYFLFRFSRTVRDRTGRPPEPV